MYVTYRADIQRKIPQVKVNNLRAFDQKGSQAPLVILLLPIRDATTRIKSLFFKVLSIVEHHLQDLM